MLASEIVKEIERILKDKGIKKQQFYEDCGISAAMMSNWRADKNYPFVATLARINEYLGSDLSLTGKAEQKEKPTPKQGELSNDQLREFMELLLRLSPEQLAVIKATAQALLAGQAERD